MKLNFPLVTYYDEGRRTGYLVNVIGDYGRVQPIGPIGTVPAKLKILLNDLRLDKTGLEPTKDSLPADAEELNQSLNKERIAVAKEKAAKKPKPVAKKKAKAAKPVAKKKAKAAKPVTVKYLELQETAPETKDLKEGSHAYAVIHGLRALSGKATRERLLEKIATDKLIKTETDPSKAISWMTGQLVGKGYIKIVKEKVAASPKCG
jgi:hypothetical protein